MESPIAITLPFVLSQWVEEQATRRGFSANDFVQDLVKKAHEDELTRQANLHLSRSMQNLLSEMSDGDWDDIRRAGRASANRLTRSHH